MFKKIILFGLLALNMVNVEKSQKSVKEFDNI